MKILVWLLIILLFIGGIGAFAAWRISIYIAASKIPTYRIAKVTRGDVIATITATGTLQPEESIDVGAQVAGRIVEFGMDEKSLPINNNSDVKMGMLLAKIDDTTYAADVSQAQAQLAQDKAAIEQAVADLAVAQAKLNQATRDWDRAKNMDADVLARETRDNYLAAFETASAQIDAQKAMIDEAKANQLRDQANLDRANRNLGYCTITSPADGVIVDRRVNIGQTVVSSLNSPSLFLLAKDLKHMWINVAVNEADIGVVEEGQPVLFTVDASPEDIFHGTVRKKRLFGQNTQNVITYPVEITAENPYRKLIPYQTANCHFEVGRKENVLVVPNAAISWTPATDRIAADVKDQAEKMIQVVDDGKPGKAIRHHGPTTHAATEPATIPGAPEDNKDKMYPGLIWIKDGNFVRPVEVKTGLSDGAYTYVESDKIHEGMEIVTGEEAKQAWGKK